MIDDYRLTTSDYLEDAAHYPGGHAPGVVFPRTTADVVDVLAGAQSILPIGAQSSLTGGATPMGELILATSRMARILDVGAARITVEPGVTVQHMQERLREAGAWFPPAPTFTGACAGGIVATNAAGAATFKYGSTRDWVAGLTVVLADGTILRITRGDRHARGGVLEVEAAHRTIAVPVPCYTMPDVPKRSAGYYAAADMDLIDLFIGSEGTLGVITEITFRILSPAPSIVLALVPCRDERQALDLVGALRRESMRTWRQHDRSGIDVCAIEHMDRRSLEIVREDGADTRHNVSVPSGTAVVLIVQLEVGAEVDATAMFDQIQNAFGSAAGETGVGRLCRMLDRAGLLADAELAAPQDRRGAALLAIREAVPAGVNQRVNAAKRTVDDRIEKTAADMVVPFDRSAEMMDIYRRGFESRRLDYAIWGHLSDGNVHPNVIPRSFEDVVSGKAAILEFGREVARLGGCPLAEHGVGRNPVKQALLRQLYGERGVDEMRAVKRALDPDWKLSPGVIFER